MISRARSVAPMRNSTAAAGDKSGQIRHIPPGSFGLEGNGRSFPQRADRCQAPGLGGSRTRFSSLQEESHVRKLFAFGLGLSLALAPMFSAQIAKSDQVGNEEVIAVPPPREVQPEPVVV